MKTDDFENSLRAPAFRPIPADWREEILKNAKDNQPHEERLQPSIVWWRQLLWPCPKAWGGLAAIWVLLLICHWSTSEKQTVSVAQTPPPTQNDIPIVTVMAFQSRSWNVLFDPSYAPPVAPKKPFVPRPRSERKTNLITV